MQKNLLNVHVLGSFGSILKDHRWLWEQQLEQQAAISLYQERAVFGKMKMDPAKRAQTQNAGEV